MSIANFSGRNAKPKSVSHNLNERESGGSSYGTWIIGNPEAPPMLRVTPINFSEANAFIKAYHRHHKHMVGCKFCIAVSEGERVRGVVMVGRPVARYLDDGFTLEVNRCCTDGAKNAPSMLYGAAWRAAKSLGYTKLITYTLPQEGGASLRASGWKLIGRRGGGNWNTPSRPRIDTRELLQGQKLLWEAP